ncbi:MAG TPA: UdgX family uracil-DNA binding protein [Caulobacter sp.]|nr:UdgX family uracil-DNA binding protein [Caulobacter sp.]
MLEPSSASDFDPAALQVVRLASETDFAGWRAAARRLRRAGTPPEAVRWTVAADEVLLGGAAPGSSVSSIRDSFAAPGALLDLAEKVICHRAPDRFATLYRLVWRLRSDPRLMKDAADPDVALAVDMAQAVSRATRDMKAFVRLRPLEAVTPRTCAAWYEPPHRVLERAAPFFIERFSNLRFSILTPDSSLHWDRRQAVFGPGVQGGEALDDDRLEEAWRAGVMSVFDPLLTKAPSGRGNLRDASSIPQAAAMARIAPMVEQAPASPSERARKAARRLSRDGTYDDAPHDLDEVVAGLEICRRCDLWRHATQAVPGEGAARAALMFVGEQPGDQEDLAGKPFVGPAGQLFDRALERAGVPRDRTYVTNAVKHFKHAPRGTRRIHETPTPGEVRACRWWLDAERRLVRPRVIVALGATAALSVFGKPLSIGASRGRVIPLEAHTQGLVTYHPSYLLRVPDKAAKAKAWAAFVDDLRMAWRLAG